VLLGEVLAVDMPSPQSSPLAYHRGRYTSVATPDGSTDLTG
jgi:hypothetical protein